MRLRIHTNMGLVSAEVQRIARALNNDANAMRPVLESIGMTVAKWHVDIFRTRGARFGGWARVNPVWGLLRRRGSGGKIRDWKGAVRNAYGLHPLNDTGRLRISMQAGGAGSVRRVGRLSVEVGTNVEYAVKHQVGGISRFSFGTQQRRTFEKNVAKTLPGAKRPGSRARKNWNPFYFQMLNYFRQKNGKAFKVKKRQIVLERLNATEQRIIQQDVTRHLDAILSEGGPTP